MQSRINTIFHTIFFSYLIHIPNVVGFDHIPSEDADEHSYIAQYPLIKESYIYLHTPLDYVLHEMTKFNVHSPTIPNRIKINTHTHSRIIHPKNIPIRTVTRFRKIKTHQHPMHPKQFKLYHSH